MPNLDITLLNKSILPTVDVQKIGLDLSPEPMLEDNPHIDHERERGILTAKDRYRRRKIKKEFPQLVKAFNGYWDNSTKAQRSLNLLHLRQLKVNLSLSLKDRLIGKKGTWSSVDDFVNALKIRVVLCADEKLYKKLSANESLFNNKTAFTKKMLNKRLIQEKVIDGRSFLDKGKYNVINARKGQMAQARAPRLINYTFDTFFMSPSSTPKFLGLFVYCYFDKKDFQRTLGIDLRTEFIKDQYFGNVTKEIIFTTQGPKLTGKAFFNAQNECVTEKVYKNSRGTYTTARKISNQIVGNRGQKLLTDWKQRNVNTQAGQYYHSLKKTLEKPPDENLIISLRKTLATWPRKGTKQATQYRRALARAISSLEALEVGEKELKMLPVPNSKLTDNRLPPILQSRKVTLAKSTTMEEEILSKINIQDKGSAPMRLSFANSLNKRSFTPLMTSLDAQSNVNLMFGMDYEAIVRLNSIYWSLFKGKSRSLIAEFSNNFKIRSLQVIRTAAADPEEKLIANLSEKYPKELMSFRNMSPNSYKNRVLYKNPCIAEEFKVSLKNVSNPNRVRFFYINDFVNKDILVKNRQGLYKYKIKLVIQDNSKKYLVAKYKRLRMATKTLIEYLGHAEQQCNFNSDSNSFTELFLNDIYDKYTRPDPGTVLNTPLQNVSAPKTNTLSDSPWCVAPSLYAEVYYQFNDIDEDDLFKSALRQYKLLEPSIATPKTIRMCVHEFEELLSQIKEVLGSIEEEALNNGPGVTKSRKSLQMIKFEHSFNEIAAVPKVHQYKTYLELPAGQSLPVVSYGAYQSRIEAEMSKILAGLGSSLGDTPQGGGTAGTEAFTDLFSTRLSYLSAIRFKTSNIDMDLSKVSLSQKRNKEIYSSLLNEVTNINMAPDPDVRQAYAPVKRKNVNLKKNLIKNQTLNSISLLSKFGLTLTPSPTKNSVIQLYTENEDGLTLSTPYMGNSNLFTNETLAEALTEACVSDAENENAVNLVEISNHVINSILSNGIIRENNTSSGNGGIKNPLNATSADSSQVAKRAFSLASYDLNNEENIFNATGMTPAQMKKLPNHIKALVLKDKSGTTEEGEPVADELADPSTQPYYMFNFFDLVEIKTLTGFFKDKSGRLFLNSPIYQTLDQGNITAASKGNIICKMSDHTSRLFGSSVNSSLKLGRINENFIIGPAPSLSRAPDRTKIGYTSGGELYDKKGKEYIGYFQRHEDGKITTGRSTQVEDETDPTRPGGPYPSGSVVTSLGDPQAAPTSPDAQGSSKPGIALHPIEPNFARKHAYMMKVSSASRNAAFGEIGKRVNAYLLKAAINQKLVLPDYVVTSEEGVSTKMLSSANTQKPGLTATSAAPVGGGGGGTMGGSSY